MSKNTLPKWFNTVVFIALLWNLLGLYFFLADLNMSPDDFAQKSAAEQELLNNIPLWSTIAYALGVFGGTIGCIGLLRKKAWSMMAWHSLGPEPLATLTKWFLRHFKVPWIHFCPSAEK